MDSDVRLPEDLVGVAGRLDALGEADRAAISGSSLDRIAEASFEILRGPEAGGGPASLRLHADDAGLGRRVGRVGGLGFGRGLGWGRAALAAGLALAAGVPALVMWGVLGDGGLTDRGLAGRGMPDEAAITLAAMETTIEAFLSDDERSAWLDGAEGSGALEIGELSAWASELGDGLDDPWAGLNGWGDGLGGATEGDAVGGDAMEGAS